MAPAKQIQASGFAMENKNRSWKNLTEFITLQNRDNKEAAAAV
jgi:hypothetical protein